MQTAPVTGPSQRIDLEEPEIPPSECKVSNVAFAAMGGVAIFAGAVFTHVGKRLINENLSTLGIGLMVIGGIAIVYNVAVCGCQYVSHDRDAYEWL